MRRAFCFVFVVCFCLLPMRVSVFAQETGARGITEVDIGIAPEDYITLTSDNGKDRLPARVGVNGSYTEMTVNLRGNTSRRLGLLTETKRVPFELKRADKVPVIAALGNHDVKFVNSLTPYLLFAEYIALDLFAWMDVPTPAHTLAFVQYNGVDHGLYIAVEDLNGTFLRKHYSNDSGVLLKNTSDTEKKKRYVNSDWFGVLFEKEGKNNKTIDLFLAALDRGEGYEAYINADEWLRFFACVAAIGGEDSIFTMMNSFAMYDNGGKFDLIPWDQSSAFGAQGPNGIDRYYVGNDPANPSPLFDLLMQNETWRAQYHAYIRQIAEGFLAKDAMDARFGALLDAAAPYFYRDHSILLNRDTVSEDLLAQDPEDPLNLRYSLEKTYENLLLQLEGKETVFYVNRAYSGLNVSPQTISALLKRFETERLDPALPQKIKDAYPAWKAAHAAPGGSVWIVLSAAAAAVLLAGGGLWAAKRKKNR